MNDYAFSVDLGGTSTNFSLFTSDEIIAEWTVPTPENSITEMLEAEIKNKISELNLKSTDFKAIVMGIAGIVKNGIVQKAINLNLPDCDIGSVLQSRVNLNLPTLRGRGFLNFFHLIRLIKY